MTKIISNEAVKRRNHWIDQIGRLKGDFAANSLQIESDLGTEINKLGTQTLLDHLRLSGNIPESYGHDTSEEK